MKASPINLHNALVLVAEDEPFIAIELALAIEDAGGRVLGPASTVAEGLDLVAGRQVDGAILDVNLADRDVEPLAVYLIEAGVSVVLQTGVGLPSALQKRYPMLSVNPKPCLASVLVREIAKLISDRP